MKLYLIKPFENLPCCTFVKQKQYMWVGFLKSFVLSVFIFIYLKTFTYLTYPNTLVNVRNTEYYYYYSL